MSLLKKKISINRTYHIAEGSAINSYPQVVKQDFGFQLRIMT